MLHKMNFELMTSSRNKWLNICMCLLFNFKTFFIYTDFKPPSQLQRKILITTEMKRVLHIHFKLKYENLMSLESYMIIAAKQTARLKHLKVCVCVCLCVCVSRCLRVCMQYMQ